MEKRMNDQKTLNHDLNAEWKYTLDESEKESIGKLIEKLPKIADIQSIDNSEFMSDVELAKDREFNKWRTFVKTYTGL